MVRAKFRVQEVTLCNCWSGGKTVIGKRIWMTPVSGQEGENKAFGDATPNGDIKMTIVLEDASSQFEINKDYYVDFSLADTK